MFRECGARGVAGSKASPASRLLQVNAVSGRWRWVSGAFLRAKKKALLSKTFLNLVPRGRLELPLLSKTDFESAASTNSAIRAMAAEYKDEITVGQSGTWRIFDISARLPGPARRTPSCALLTLLSSSLIR